MVASAYVALNACLRCAVTSGIGRDRANAAYNQVATNQPRTIGVDLDYRY
jgi:hypothetical protein